MHKNFNRTTTPPQPLAGTGAPKQPAVAAPEPENPGLTRDELRRIVLDIVG